MNNTFKLVLAGALCTLPSIAQACSCLAPPAPKIALEQAAAVFVGHVTSVEKGAGSNTFQFAVSKKWKGVKGDVATIVSGSNSAACGIVFDNDRDYLVYAYKIKDSEQLATNLCMRTKRVADAAADLAELGEPMSDAQNANAVIKPIIKTPTVTEENGSVQVNAETAPGDAAQPLVLLNQTLKSHSTAKKIRLNWSFDWKLNTFPPTIRSGSATALYNRDDSTLKLYAKYGDAVSSSIKSVLYAGVTDEKLEQLAAKYQTGGDAMENFAFLDNLPEVGATATDLGSTIQKRRIFNLK